MTTLAETNTFGEGPRFDIAAGGSSVPVVVVEVEGTEQCVDGYIDCSTETEVNISKITAAQLNIMIEEQRHLGKICLADSEKLRQLVNEPCESIERKARKARSKVGKYSRRAESLPGPLNASDREAALGQMHKYWRRSLQIAWLLDMMSPREDSQPWREALWLKR